MSIARSSIAPLNYEARLARWERERESNREKDRRKVQIVSAERRAPAMEKDEEEMKDEIWRYASSFEYV